MEQFKEQIKARNRSTVISILIWFAIAIFGFVCEAGDFLMPVSGDSHWASLWHGFISGVTTAFLVVMIAELARNLRALKDETKLRKLYIEKTDERNIKIMTSAQSAAMRTFLTLGLAAGIVAGYFNVTVSITILACTVLHSLIGLAYKLYYNRKF